jgi:hypothetical protein
MLIAPSSTAAHASGTCHGTTPTTTATTAAQQTTVAAASCQIQERRWEPGRGGRPRYSRSSVNADARVHT